MAKNSILTNTKAVHDKIFEVMSLDTKLLEGDKTDLSRIRLDLKRETFKLEDFTIEIANDPVDGYYSPMIERFLDNEFEMVTYQEKIKIINNYKEENYKESFSFLDKFLRFLFKLFKKTYVKKQFVVGHDGFIADFKRKLNKIITKHRLGHSHLACFISPEMAYQLKSNNNFIYYHSEDDSNRSTSIYRLGSYMGIPIYIALDKKIRKDEIIFVHKEIPISPKQDFFTLYYHLESPKTSTYAEQNRGNVTVRTHSVKLLPNFSPDKVYNYYYHIRKNRASFKKLN